ncbi:hypothetical protein Ahy_A04g017273 [Arachis hypogaea]|uniref:Uncharacterized protein n=1 Tax=Arachis hypogaea TaxID=3818 RepID=A0A445DAM7_ARAHY|nr:hypothetical protein Ahy_A04g017273 [Arachis hypogaea]
MEQDGNIDGSLQVDFDIYQAHADRIQSELDELVKSLNEWCKKYGLRAKATTLVELPFDSSFMYYLRNNECPTCQTHCASRGSLRDDPKYDVLYCCFISRY